MPCQYHYDRIFYLVLMVTFFTSSYHNNLPGKIENTNLYLFDNQLPVDLFGVYYTVSYSSFYPAKD